VALRRPKPLEWTGANEKNHLIRATHYLGEKPQSKRDSPPERKPNQFEISIKCVKNRSLSVIRKPRDKPKGSRDSLFHEKNQRIREIHCFMRRTKGCERATIWENNQTPWASQLSWENPWHESEPPIVRKPKSKRKPRRSRRTMLCERSTKRERNHLRRVIQNIFEEPRYRWDSLHKRKTI